MLKFSHILMGHQISYVHRGKYWHTVNILKLCSCILLKCFFRQKAPTVVIIGKKSSSIKPMTPGNGSQCFECLQPSTNQPIFAVLGGIGGYSTRVEMCSREVYCFSRERNNNSAALAALSAKMIGQLQSSTSFIVICLSLYVIIILFLMATTAKYYMYAVNYFPTFLGLKIATFASF